jgi:DNA processing protein
MAEKELRRADDEQVKLLFYLDADFPKRLRQVIDSPTLLYVRGKIDFENEKSIAIVGTRNATSYGKERVEELITGLVLHQALIVSGLAYGIDILAHKSAEKNGLPTVAVMGSGIDIIYPSAHTEVARRIQNNGGIVTENPFGTKPDAHNFPARNRIIAALCDALIVVEAAEKGGALITANIANTYNKDIFAFPGGVDQPYSMGCNNLIKSNRANLITSVKDLEYIMNWEPNAADTKKKAKVRLELSAFDAQERSVLEVLYEKSHMLVDELSWKSQLPMGILATTLLGLEFKGVIQSLPGKAYKLVRD